MVSRMASGDWAKIASRKLNTPVGDCARLFADCVKMNALGLRVEKSPESIRYAVLPRVAFLADGALVLHEPTVAHLMWMESMARAVKGQKTKYNAIMCAVYCLATPPAELCDGDDPKAIARSVGAFFKKSSARLCTLGQLDNAVDYVMYGADPLSEENMPSKHKAPEDVSFAVGIYRYGLSLKIGSPSEVAKMSMSDLIAVCDYLMARDGTDPKAEESRAFGEYCRFRAQVAERKAGE